MRLNPSIAERLDDEDYPIQNAVDFLQAQLDSGMLKGINEGAVCVVRDALWAREEHIAELDEALANTRKILEIFKDRMDEFVYQELSSALNP